jgi:hypothetical protein
MNFKTTFVLLLLAAGGGAFFWFGWDAPTLSLSSRKEANPDLGTREFLEQELTADKLTRIDVQRGDQHVVLTRGQGGDWSLPGHWPTRKPEVEGLVHDLTDLRSRFSPIPVGGQEGQLHVGPATWKPDLTIVTQTATGEHRLEFAEESSDANRFTQATYLRVDGKNECLRLAPGLIALLDRPQSYYQQRRLFPSERVARSADSADKVERLAAQTLAVKSNTNAYTVTKAADEWDLTAPVHDHADPDKLKAILTAVPDIWAERFITEPKKTPADYGLDKPEDTIQVTRDGGATVTLLLGKESQVKTRTVMRPAPSFGGPPMPPQREVIHEPYRYAKLQNNDQVFEIRADKLKDVFVAADTLRDARLARFRTEDVRRFELDREGQKLVAVKDKERWRLEKPFQADAEASKITEILDKLSNLQANDKDIIDKGDPKTYGLDKPSAEIRLTVEEEKKPATNKVTKTFTFDLGKHADKSKLYVKVAGWDRINAVEDSVLKLVDRPALAYRGRRVLDFNASDLAKIEVHRPAGAYTLEQAKGTWRLAAPVSADLDSFKADQLAGDLGRLEAVEFASETAPPADLEKTYGLTKPALTATATFSDAKKPAQTLQIGNQLPGKAEYYAKLAGSRSVFIVKKDIRDAVDQDSLSFRPAQIFQMSAEDINELRITKEGPEYRLEKLAADWKIAGPFDATATSSQVRTMTDEISNLRCERYAAHSAKDPAAFGLDKPYLRVVVREAAKITAKDSKEKPVPPKERTLIVGKLAAQDTKARYAKLGDGEAVFVVSDKAVAALDHNALDLLDKDLLTLDTKTIQRIQSTSPAGKLTLQLQGQDWRVLDTPAPPFPADREVSKSALEPWANLRAVRFADYGHAVDWKKYSLDKPEASVTITMQGADGKDKAAKPVEHTVALGKKVDAAGDTFARVDNNPGVVVLSAAVVANLTHGYLDFVDHTVLKLDAAQVSTIDRRMGNDNLEIVRRDGEWRLLKPQTLPADRAALDSLVDQLANLRASKIAAYPARDVKAYGLDNPEVIITLRMTQPGGKTAEHVLKLGKKAGDATAPDARFAIADSGTTVFVIAQPLAQRLVASVLQFRDRDLTHFTDADRVVLERGPRKAAFTKADGTWKMTEPIDAPAEQTDLDEFAVAASKLRADELVAEKPTDLKPFGLDKPEARWNFFAANKEVLSLLVGGTEKAPTGRRYAKIAGNDLVFLLTPQLTTKVLGEYRTRTVWPSLDAFQIDRLAYGYAEHPFVLTKPDNDWVLEGKPGVKIKAEAVRETLDALAGLKAERYVVDKGADLKLFGLEPPQLSLSIQTKSGKRVLQVGRQEGGSKRYYARVPDTDVSAVFLISETDSARIVRSLAAFTTP